jgi:alanine racemase
MFTLKKIADLTGAEFHGGADLAVSFFLTDSRSLQTPDGTIFVALRSRRTNGHYFIPDLIEKGVRAFLVEKDEIDVSLFKNASFVVSENPLQALQKLAAAHRRQFNIPVIGITGSNGKTVVKEWLYQTLKDRYSICRSPKSYNSQIGVPLSVLNLASDHQLGIFEAGISLPGEMQKLAEIIRPTIGVFTALSTAHDEGFTGRSEKILEKFELFGKCEKIFVNGLRENEIPEQYRSRSVVVNPLNQKNFPLPFSDEASLANASTVAELLRFFDVPEKLIMEKLVNLHPVALRLELKSGINSSLLINDYYNSDLDSLRIALNYLQQQKRYLRKVVIVSDIEQSGMAATKLYKEIAGLFSGNQIDLVVGIGKEISKHRSLFRSGSLFFEDTRSFTEAFPAFGFQLSSSSILLKGARSFGFEKISRLLQQKSHDTVFEINLNRLAENVNYYRSLLSEKVKLMCMVKAMGYGSGSAEVARTLEHLGVNYLAVAYADEGVELRNALVKLPIMVMSPESEAFDDIITYRLEPEIYSLRLLKQFIDKIDAMGVTEAFPIHLKIDTGMHRLGFLENDFDELCSVLRESPQVRIRSVFSHMAASDNPLMDGFTNSQKDKFERACDIVEKTLGYSFLKHLCNSGGITRFPSAHYDMVRLGIGMYGIGVNAEEQKNLQNVGALKTRISQIKSVKKGESVGYNRNGPVSKDTRIAVIPIGYADGFGRSLGNGRHGVFVNGKWCVTIGNICMDMCMIDVSGCEVQEGDEAVIFENAEQIEEMAKAMSSIAYEVLTSVSGRVKRIYVQE